MTQASENNFDSVAPIYDWLTTLSFGDVVRRAQCALFSELGEIGDSVLIIGGGTGHFLLDLLKATRAPRVLYIEKSARMLQLSQQLIEKHRPDWLSRVEFRLGTEESLTEADGPFDLVVTNFFLSCFGQANCDRITQRLHRRLAANGRWLLVDFNLPERGWKRVFGRLCLAPSYAFFNVFSNLEAQMPPRYVDSLKRLGMRTSTQRHFAYEMIRALVFSRAMVWLAAPSLRVGELFSDVQFVL